MLEEVSGKAHNLEVGGSNPPSATTICVLSSAVEHLVYTERVGGSTPSGRTSFSRYSEMVSPDVWDVEAQVRFLLPRPSFNMGC